MSTRYVYSKYALTANNYSYNGLMEIYEEALVQWFNGSHWLGYNGPEDCGHPHDLFVGDSISLKYISTPSNYATISYFTITNLRSLSWTPYDYDEELGDYWSYKSIIPSGCYFTRDSNEFYTTSMNPSSLYNDPCEFGFIATSDIEIIRWYDEEYGEDQYDYISGTAECVKIGYSKSSTSSGYATSSSSTMNSTTSYIYEYVGSDNIDPIAISATSNFSIGSSCTINITAGTGKNYDGTVSYVIQYSTNNGSTWSNLTTTTSTSYTFTLSGAMTQVKFRAYAKDNLGFTSSTYVYSSNYAVKSFMVHTSVNGSIKGANPVVAVGGGYVPQRLSSARAALSRLYNSIFSSHCYFSPQSILSLKY